MTAPSLSHVWTAVAPALGNHLWQSTLFAAVAGLLTLILRKNQARARYGLWLAASVKFLVPFSVLAGLGSHLAFSHASAAPNGGLYSVVEQVGQPFTPATAPAISHAASSTAPAGWVHLLPALLAATWLCGFVAVLLVWSVRWWRITATLRRAVPLREGREVEALRRLARMGGLRGPLEMLSSRATLEPGIFGIVRPVLVWPAGISQHLEDFHLEAILAHEVWHVRRRDNLAAAIHMVVEAGFWFHPLVWWLGARLVEERERACDEKVLEELGDKRQVYAEGILKVCEFCVGSPLACVSGVTGADLKKRIVRIMTGEVVRRLDLSRKLLLLTAGLIAIVAPIVFGQANASQSGGEAQRQGSSAGGFAYEVASIKPNKAGNNLRRMMYTPDGISVTGGTLQALLEEAYGVQNFQISGAPAWLNSERYDIEAKIDGSVADDFKKLTADQRRLERARMLQKLLADRCKLTVHIETRELPVYALVVAKNGPKFQEAKTGESYPSGIKGPDGIARGGMMRMGRGELTGQGVPLTFLVSQLSRHLGRTVLDKTGLTGNYDFTLQWTPDDGQGPMLKGPDGGQPAAEGAPPESSGPSVFTALEEQLGLKLESQKGPVEIVVIDHVEKPSEN
jgi:uncharacterized protein (TIGR03435 family)